MQFTNSSLVSYTKISPNRTVGRNHAIDTITIHCVVGQCSIEALGSQFSSSSVQASSNYGIGYDGRIGMYVEEKDRSWCSSNAANDHRAITIECASDTTAPYAINSAVYKSLINLCADICKRNGIKELKWKADKSLIGQVDKQNMTVHRWFANKSCPGDYIYNRLGQIASEVNAKLGIVASSGSTNTSTNTSKKSIEEIAKEVIAGKWGSGSDRKNALTNAGYNYSAVQSKVNELLSNKVSKPTKTVDELAKEVISGKWGSGTNRINALKNAGYDYDAVQKKVNELMSNSSKKTVTEIAKEVIAGKWGNGTARINALKKAGYDPVAIQKKVNELL